MNLEESFVSIGDPLSKHVSKARDITNMMISYDLFTGRRLSTGEPFSRHAKKARDNYQHEDILRYVQHAPDDISWTFDQAEFDELLALKKDSSPGLDGIPYGVYR